MNATFFSLCHITKLTFEFVPFFFTRICRSEDPRNCRALSANLLGLMNRAVLRVTTLIVLCLINRDKWIIILDYYTGLNIMYVYYYNRNYSQEK